MGLVLVKVSLRLHLPEQTKALLGSGCLCPLSFWHGPYKDRTKTMRIQGNPVLIWAGRFNICPVTLTYP